MTKKEKNPGKPSRAEMLIEEAVKAVEAGDHSNEPVELEEVKERDPRESGAIAKIDVQQVIAKETYLRLAADFENFRNRALKERQDAERSGKEKVLRGFLDILDNMDRGLAQSSETGPLADGIRMVVSQIDVWLKSEGLVRIQTEGKIFDPNVHEAVSQVESQAHAPGLIIKEVRRGYKWADRLFRPAGVIVCKKEERDASISEVES